MCALGALPNYCLLLQTARIFFFQSYETGKNKKWNKSDFELTLIKI